MFGAFLDESFDTGGQGVYAVAAVFGDGWRVLKGERLWQELLAKYRIRKFKSSRFAKSPEVIAEFASAIRQSGLIASAVIAKQEVFRQHLGDSPFHKQYRESPYMLLYQHMFVSIAMDLRRGRSSDFVSYVCDENARYLKILTDSYPQLKGKNRNSAPFMGSFSVQKDEDCIPLQMADLLAGQLRRQGREWLDGTVLPHGPLKAIIDAGVLWSVRGYDHKGFSAVRDLVTAESVQSGLSQPR